MRLLTRYSGTILKAVPKWLLSNAYIKKAEEIMFFYNLNTILNNSNINLAFDVGANIGSYSLLLRETGFKKQIIAFEPIHKYYLLCKQNLLRYPDIKVENIALGDHNGTSKINIASNNGQSSSILTFNIPNITTISKEKISLLTLSTYLEKNNLFNKNIFLKLDVQGYEFKILKGIKNFDNIQVIQLEMALVHYYEKETLFPEMFAFMNDIGYKIVLLKDLGKNNKGEIQYLDVVFKKNS
ncbi:MAG: FkbM family methyltransferase [Candidatus Woesearchaeota archaeon]